MTIDNRDPDTPNWIVAVVCALMAAVLVLPALVVLGYL